MRRIKKAPAGKTAKGQRAIPVSYSKPAILSTAADILFTLIQAPDNEAIRRTCFERLEQVLRAYYSERAGA